MSTQTQKITVVPASLQYVDSFRQCLDSVARQRKWLAVVEAFPIEQTRDFVARHIAQDDPMFFAMDGDRVVGWVDITRDPYRAVSRHRGTLGMGVHQEYRGRGLGKRLLQAALDKAKAIGLIRIELGVYSSNTAALALYRKLGFVEEGRKVKDKYLDGQFDDVILMAIIFDENLPPEADV